MDKKGFKKYKPKSQTRETFESGHSGILLWAAGLVAGTNPSLVGKDALAETDKITLETAKLLREDYLAQNAFTPYDKFCPFYKSVWMLRNIIHFYNLANQAVERGAGMDGQKITYTLIKHRLGDLFYRLVSQKFEDPAEGEDVLVAKFQKLHDDLIAGFRNLEDETR
ncbi:V-type proton ATPase catalytic subunit A [Capsicum baccatum]|uniref:V-type proton ATPase catalytic subunit A n=1 Tax=Capsicum baccatum TaxID=33114 RepID=A0A2G2VHC5_CAPBA|nr:V-type proton ATPase catalytic subunit A [Capsicum baccatum]